MRRDTLAVKLTVFLFLGFMSAAYAASESKSSFIRRDGALLRAEPRLHATALSRLGNGEKVQILGRQGVWSKVRAGHTTGWVPARFLGDATMRLPAANAAGDFEALKRLEARGVSDAQLDKFRSSARLVPR